MALYDKFSSTSNVACRYSILTNPIESTIRDYLYDAAYDLTSINILFHGEAMLGKTCAVRKTLDALKKVDPTNFHFYYYMYDDGTDFSNFVSDLYYPYETGPYSGQALQVALNKYNALRVANNLTTNALIVIDLSSSNLSDLQNLQSLAKAALDREYQIRLVFITSNFVATKMRNYSIKRIHLHEGSDMLAKQYLHTVAGIKDQQQIDEIVKFTGSNFKYLKIVAKPWRDCCSESITEDIHSKSTVT
jgi:hypothetical protein